MLFSPDQATTRVLTTGQVARLMGSANARVQNQLSTMHEDAVLTRLDAQLGDRGNGGVWNPSGSKHGQHERAWALTHDGWKALWS
jgi:hypothetical protein